MDQRYLPQDGTLTIAGLALTAPENCQSKFKIRDALDALDRKLIEILVQRKKVVDQDQNAAHPEMDYQALAAANGLSTYVVKQLFATINNQQPSSAMHENTKKQISDFLGTSSITTFASVYNDPNLILEDIFAPGTRLHTTHGSALLEQEDRKEILKVARKILAAGMVPVPHLAARKFSDRQDFEQFLQELIHIGVQDALVLGGGNDPRGAFGSAIDLLNTGLFSGFSTIGIGGYPQGHQRIPQNVLDAAIAEKLQFARYHGLNMHIVTLLSYNTDAIIAWTERLREVTGYKQHLVVGIAGPSTLNEKFAFAEKFGLKEPEKLLAAQGSDENRAALLNEIPDRTITDLIAQNIRSGRQLYMPHFYALGPVSLRKTALFIQKMRSGAFDMNEMGTGFTVDVNQPKETNANYSATELVLAK